MSNHNQQRPAVPTPPTAQTRDSRDDTSREGQYRVESWAPPETLPEVRKIPGWAYRWIRTAALGEDDAMNVNRSFREGWSAVAPDEQPHLTALNDSRAAQRGSIEIGGLLLCKCPEKLMQQRTQHYEGLTRQAQKSVDNTLMKEQDARMPLFKERKTKVTFGSGDA